MANILTLVKDDSEEVVQQFRRHEDAVGGSLPLEIIDDILHFAADAKLPEFYLDKEGEDLWYEMLKKDGLPAKVRQIADTWVKIEGNLERAGKQVRRTIPASDSPLITHFAFCRFKATAATDAWYFLEDGPGADDLRRKEETMVFVALQELGPHNGFPFHLKRGQDVCMDGNTGIWTPPTGGGLAVCFSLSL